MALNISILIEYYYFYQVYLFRMSSAIYSHSTDCSSFAIFHWLNGEPLATKQLIYWVIDHSFFLFTEIWKILELLSPQFWKEQKNEDLGAEGAEWTGTKD